MCRLVLPALLSILFMSSVSSISPAASAPAFNPDDWELAFSDDFERKDVGGDWLIAGDARIEKGRLRYGEDGTHVALVDRHFPADVRVEFDAEAVPNRPPCDLSVVLACGTENGLRYGYLLAFGGMGNTGHQIIGGNTERVYVQYPPKLIEHGRVYRIAGTKEGRTLTLEVDGEVLLTNTDPDPLGGKGFDMAGVLTWHGMFVDNVRVYTRKQPHPDTPRYVNELAGLPLVLDENRKLAATVETDDPAVQWGIELFNAGKPEEAEEAFLQAKNDVLRVAGVAYSLGHLYYQETWDDCKRVGAMLVELAAAHPDDARLHDYAELGRQLQGFSLLRGTGLPNGEQAVTRVMMMGQAHNPLYDKAQFYKARFLRAHAQEGAASQDVPNAMFAELKQWYPDEPSLRELCGEAVPWGEELIDDTSDAPAWARYLRELYARQCAVLHEWFANRQLPDGQLGGGWGDDVEILRSWGPVAAISNGDPAIVDGIERLCEGMWQVDLSEYGFAGYGDVEHSSEPSADTLPTIMVLRWGDPLWIERNLRSAKTIRDIYMGIDDRGYYRFKSAFFGHDIVGRLESEGGDTHYNTRAAKHLQHLALWGNTEAKRVYLNWVDGWLAQTMADYPDKPAGFVPSSIFYPDGGIYPPGSKTHYGKDLHFMETFPGMGLMIQGAFLAGYKFTGDWKYLQPMQHFLHWTSYGPLYRGEQEPGTWDWMIAGQQYSMTGDTLAMYRWLSGDRTTDEYLLRFASPAQRYYVTNDLERYLQSVEHAAKGLRTGFRLMTRETLQTDRAGLRGDTASFGAFTGGLHIWRESLLPSMAVTWDVPDTDFAALVVNRTPTRVRAWVYSFHDEPIRMGMRVWELVPGVYTASRGEILPGEDTNLRYHWAPTEDFTVRRRLDTYYFDAPPRVPYCVDLRLVEPLEVPETAPDPAIADRDLTLGEDGSVTLVVHNLGNAPTQGVVVALEALRDGKWTEAARTRTGTLPAPGLEPVTEVVTFEAVPGAASYRAVLDPDNAIDELYEGNNRAVR